MNIAQTPRNGTPTFDPRSAFAWTRRAGEAARLEVERGKKAPTFDPRSAFAWTQRSAEIARRDRRSQLGVLVAA